MSRGSPAFGKRHSKTHTLSRLTGTKTWHKQKRRCANAGAGTKKRRYNWSTKAKRRNTTGTGRASYLKKVWRREKNGFRAGTQAKAVKAKKAESK